MKKDYGKVYAYERYIVYKPIKIYDSVDAAAQDNDKLPDEGAYAIVRRLGQNSKGKGYLACGGVIYTKEPIPEDYIEKAKTR